MKHKITIDKLIASSQHHAAPPPPDADLMWADMMARLGAEAPTDSATASDAPVGPAPAAAATKVTTVAAWVFSGLLGISILYAVASRQMAAASENTHLEVQPEAAAGQQPESWLGGVSTLGEGTTSTDSSSVAKVGEAQVASAALAPDTGTSSNTISAPAAAQRTMAQSSPESYGGNTAMPSSPAPEASLVPTASTRTRTQTPAQAPSVPTTSQAAAEEAATTAFDKADSPEAAGTDAIEDNRAMPAEGPTSLHMALLPSSSPAVLKTPAPALARPLLVVPSSTSPLSAHGLLLYAGRSLGKTPTVYQNYTPAISYLNLGMAYRVSLGSRWSFQPELWLMQLETPRLSVVTEQRLDLDGERLFQSDTVSTMRMRGIGLNLMMGAELPAGFTLLGGLHLGRYAGIMSERASSTRSLVSGLGSSSWGFTYTYNPAPDWFQVYQVGMKLGIEKHFWQKIILGASVYQGLSDLVRERESGPGNYSTGWVVYAGYRW